MESRKLAKEISTVVKPQVAIVTSESEPLKSLIRLTVEGNSSGSRLTVSSVFCGVVEALSIIECGLHDMDVIVDGERLLSLLSNFDGEIELSTDGKNLFINSCGENIAILPVADIQPTATRCMDTDNIKKMVKIHHFADMVNGVAHACAKGDDPTWSKIFVRTFKNGEALVYATDIMMISIRKSSSAVGVEDEAEETFDIPGKHLVNAVNVMEDDDIYLGVAKNGNYVVLKDEKHICAISLKDNTLFAIENQVKIPKRFHGVVMVDRMVDSLRFARQIDGTGILNVANNVLKVEATAECGRTSVLVKGSFSGADLRMKAGIDRVISAFCSLNSAKAEIFARNEREPFFVVNPEGTAIEEVLPII